MNQCCPEYYEQLLEANSDILQTLSQRSERKHMFVSTCKAMSLGYTSCDLATSRTTWDEQLK